MRPAPRVCHWGGALSSIRRMRTLIYACNHDAMRRATPLAVVLVLFLAACSSPSPAVPAIQSTGTRTTAAPKADSGIDGCKALAAMGSGTKFTEATYTATRAQFAGSTSADLRSTGVKFVEAAWKADTTQDLSLIPQLFTDYGALSAACAAHGQALPSLSS